MNEVETSTVARRLQSWPYLKQRIPSGLVIHGYQIESVAKVIHQLDANAILADEVGLGKTIEAGLIISELKARGAIDRVLVLVPAGLITQWIGELGQKFGFEAMRSPKDQGWLWVLSIDTAKRPPLSVQLQYVEWDLVIVDEAHHLKNAETQNYQLVAGLKRRHLLLLTATPMENQLNELYILVNLVKPGYFGSYLKFYRQFILDKRTPKNARELRKLLAQVMVRNQRQEVGLNLPPRQVMLWPIRLSGPEQELYHALTAALKIEYRNRLGNPDKTLLPLILMQRELCSSPRALLSTLARQDWLGAERDRLLGLAASIQRPEKVRQVVQWVQASAERTLIFTEYRGTQDTLVEALSEAGVEAECFHGGIQARDRDTLIDWFQSGESRVLVSTEAGGQGLNMQFCHRLLNFDLPWNPMRIEQRIGRLHRIGQRHPVEIFNLYSIGTIEEDILRLLHEKIDLFRHVIGELDVILRHLQRRGSLEHRLLDIFFWEDDHDQVVNRLDQLGREFHAARDRFRWPEGAPPEGDDGEIRRPTVHVEYF